MRMKHNNKYRRDVREPKMPDNHPVKKHSLKAAIYFRKASSMSRLGAQAHVRQIRKVTDHGILMYSRIVVVMTLNVNGCTALNTEM